VLEKAPNEIVWSDGRGFLVAGAKGVGGVGDTDQTVIR
jgi:hypothetical protein